MKILHNWILHIFDDPAAFARCASFELKTFGDHAGADFPFRFDRDFFEFYDRTVAPAFRPDCILFFWPEYKPVPLNFHRVPVPKIAVVSDWNLGVNVLPDALALFDQVFCDKNGVDIINRMGYGAEYWQQYSSSWGRDRPRPEEGKIYDIGFIGNLNCNVQRDREKWLRRLAGLGEKYRVGLFGGVYEEEYARTLARCKIVFNRSIRGEMNLRCWEAPANGALLFLEEENAEVRDYLEPGKEVVLYNERNFEELLDHYLAHPEERERMVRACQAKLEEHRYALRFARLLDRIRPRLAGWRAPAAPPPGAAYVYACHQTSPVVKERLIREGMAAGASPEEGRRQLCLLRHQVWDKVRRDQPGYGEAVRQAYAAQLEEFPGDLVSCLNYGKFLVHKERWEEAMEVFLRGMETLGRAPDLRNNLTGVLYPPEADYEKGLWYQAGVEAYRRGPDSGPLFDFFRSRFLYYTGRCLCRAGHLDRALDCAQKALLGRKDLTDVWALTGEIRYRQGDFSQAANAFLRAAECSPLNLEMYVCAANCYRRLDLPAEADAAVAEARMIRKNIQNYTLYDEILAQYKSA